MTAGLFAQYLPITIFHLNHYVVRFGSTLVNNPLKFSFLNVFLIIWRCVTLIRLLFVVELADPAKTRLKTNVATENIAKNQHQEVEDTGNRIEEFIDLRNFTNMILDGHIQAEIEFSNEWVVFFWRYIYLIVIVKCHIEKAKDLRFLEGNVPFVDMLVNIIPKSIASIGVLSMKFNGRKIVKR